MPAPQRPPLPPAAPDLPRQVRLVRHACRARVAWLVTLRDGTAAETWVDGAPPRDADQRWPVADDLLRHDGHDLDRAVTSTHDAHEFAHLHAADQPPLRFLHRRPILSAQGHVVAVLGVLDTESWPDGDVRFAVLDDAVPVLAHALGRRRADLLAEWQRIALLQTLGADSVEQGLAQALDVVCRELGWPAGHGLLMGEDGALHSSGIWHLKAGHAFAALVQATTTARFPLGIGVPGLVARDLQPVWIEDTRVDPRFFRGQQHPLPVCAVFAFPLLSRDKLFGVLEFFSDRPRRPAADLLDTLAGIGPELGRALHLRQVISQLGSTEQLKAAMVEAALDCIVTIDDGNRVLDFNPAAERTFGYRKDEVLGHDMVECIVPPAFRDAHRKGVQRYLATGAARVLGRRTELTGMRKDGAEFPMELTVVEIRMPGARRFTAFLRDLTEQQRLAEQLRESQRLDAMGRLAGGVAHDFNNLLAVILGTTSLMLEDGTVGEHLRPDLEAIQTAGERGAALVRQLLTFSRRQVLQPRPIDVNATLSEIADLLRRTVGEDVTLTTDLDPHLRATSIDPTQMQQVLMNLVVNARDAMPAGGELLVATGNVTLDKDFSDLHGGLRPGEYVRLTVSDTGAGMTHEVQQRIFEPFFTTKPHGQGTGLGLSTVYGIVQQAQGGLQVHSEPGVGTSFHVYLPAVEAPAIGSPVVPARAPQPGRGQVVLLVEDEAPVRHIVQRVLTQQGYEVIATRSALDALEVARVPERRVDLLLTDVVMPGLSGRDLAEQVRSLRPRCPILFMSGFAEDVVTRGLPDATALLTKPFTRQTLLLRVEAMLHGP